MNNLKKNVKEDFKRLKERDVYSILLFILFQLGTIPKYRILRDMLFMLDRKTLLKLCEYYGGKTVTFPTTEELERALKLLALYEHADIEGKTIQASDYDEDLIKDYIKLREVLSNYNV